MCFAVEDIRAVLAALPGEANGPIGPWGDRTAGVFPGRAAQRCPDRADRDAWRAAGPVIRGSENKLKACSRTLSATNGRDNPLT